MSSEPSRISRNCCEVRWHRRYGSFEEAKMKRNSFELEAFDIIQAADFASALAHASFDASRNTDAITLEGSLLMEESAANDLERAIEIVGELARELLEYCGGGKNCAPAC